MKRRTILFCSDAHRNCNCITSQGAHCITPHLPYTSPATVTRQHLVSFLHCMHRMFPLLLDSYLSFLLSFLLCFSRPMASTPRRMFPLSFVLWLSVLRSVLSCLGYPLILLQHQHLALEADALLARHTRFTRRCTANAPPVWSGTPCTRIPPLEYVQPLTYYIALCHALCHSRQRCQGPRSRSCGVRCGCC